MIGCGNVVEFGDNFVLGWRKLLKSRAFPGRKVLLCFPQMFIISLLLRMRGSGTLKKSPVGLGD